MTEKDYCEDCHQPADIYQMDRKWCKECWESFKEEYNQWVEQNET